MAFDSKKPKTLCLECGRVMHLYCGHTWKNEPQHLKHCLCSDTKGTKLHKFICPYSHVRYIEVV